MKEMVEAFKKINDHDENVVRLTTTTITKYLGNAGHCGESVIELLLKCTEKQ